MIVESFTSESTKNEVVYNSSEKTEYPLRTIIDEVNSKKFINNYLFMKRVCASRAEKTTSKIVTHKYVLNYQCDD